MPVPLILNNGKLVVAIEDTGERTSRALQPSILHADPDNGAVIGASDSRRLAAIASLDEQIYAGDPFIQQLSSGETLLSCQYGTLQGRRAHRMAIFMGDASAANFTRATAPLQTPAEWNSLFVRDDDTIVALAGTSIAEKSGVWAIDGRAATGKAD